MKGNTYPYYDSIKEELKQLEIKNQKLTEFIKSEEFIKLCDKHKFLLFKQLEIQILYIESLKLRLKLIESEN